MRENLRTFHFNDGTAIDEILLQTDWDNTSDLAWCWYENNAKYNLIFGKLYYGITVDSAINGNNNICPIGWHVPSESDWLDLAEYLGGLNNAGGLLKEADTAYWSSPKYVVRTLKVDSQPSPEDIEQITRL